MAAMPNRRQFLGALVAAPIVAKAVTTAPVAATPYHITAPEVCDDIEIIHDDGRIVRLRAGETYTYNADGIPGYGIKAFSRVNW